MGDSVFPQKLHGQITIFVRIIAVLNFFFGSSEGRLNKRVAFAFGNQFPFYFDYVFISVVTELIV